MNAPLPKLQAGIHQMTMPEYLAIKALSSGLVHTLLAQSACHAKTEQDAGPSETSAIAEKGIAVHDALLEGVNRIAVINPEDYAGSRGGIPKGWTTDAIKGARDAARADGKIPLFPENAANVLNAVQAARAYVATTELRGIFDSGKPEQTFVWEEYDRFSPGPGKPTEKRNIVLCKARPDCLTADHSIMLHVKTTSGSAAPGPFSRVADSMGYDVAVMFYERGLAAVAPGKPVKSYLLAIEQDSPHGCKLYDLHQMKAEIAAAKVSRAIKTWQECAASGKYPAYDSAVHTLEPKPWNLQEAEDSGLIDSLSWRDTMDPQQLQHGMQI